jgi:cytochrome c
MRFVLTSLAAFLISTSLLAEDVNLAGDRDLGDLAFQKQCVACHIVVNSSGKKLAGRNGRSGPNLHNVSGAVAGIVDGYRYGRSIVAAGAKKGLIWNEKNFVAYVQDPKSFLRLFLGDKKARAKMTYKVRREKDARDIYAYLLSLSDNQ